MRRLTPLIAIAALAVLVAPAADAGVKLKRHIFNDAAYGVSILD